MGELRDCWRTRESEPCAEIVPESDALLDASFVEAEEGVSAVASGIAAGSPADLAFGDLAADVVFGAIGVQGDLGPVENLQQLALVGMKACE